MKKLTLLIFIGICGSLRAQTTHRVVNGTNLQEFIDNVVTAGDKIILEGGDYSSLTLTKKVTIIGTGFFLDENNNATPRTAILGDVIFNAGSEQSLILGMTVNSFFVNCNNINIKRCYVRSISIGFTTKADNCYLQGNYVYAYPGIQVLRGSESFIIRNNIILNDVTFETSGVGYLWYNSFIGNKIGFSLPESVEIKNNIFQTLTNNYPFGGSLSYLMRNYQPGLIFYNIFGQNNYSNLSSDFTTLYHNTLLASPQIFYKGYPDNSAGYKKDEQFILGEFSPAKGACENGSDCGAFGGSEPYILGGTPNIPSITQMAVEVNGNTLNVQIKAKANN